MITISVAEADVLKKDLGFTLAEIAAEYDIDLSTAAGSANVAAREVVPVVKPNTELIAQATALFAQGHKGQKTKKGRSVRVLGAAEGLVGYSIVVYHTPTA